MHMVGFLREGYVLGCRVGAEKNYYPVVKGVFERGVKGVVEQVTEGKSGRQPMLSMLVLVLPPRFHKKEVPHTHIACSLVPMARASTLVLLDSCWVLLLEARHDETCCATTRHTTVHQLVLHVRVDTSYSQ